MYKIFESAMSNPFDLPVMLEKINRHHIMGNLNDDERDRLESLARRRANPSGSLDVMAKLQELDNRIRALEAYHAADGGTAETVEEYTPGKWYRNGDKAAYNGSVYVCIAPDGVVCVWSPAEYPAYWNVAAD